MSRKLLRILFLFWVASSTELFPPSSSDSPFSQPLGPPQFPRQFPLWFPPQPLPGSPSQSPLKKHIFLCSPSLPFSCSSALPALLPSPLSISITISFLVCLHPSPSPSAPIPTSVLSSVSYPIDDRLITHGRKIQRDEAPKAKKNLAPPTTAI